MILFIIGYTIFCCLFNLDHLANISLLYPIAKGFFQYTPGSIPGTMPCDHPGNVQMANLLRDLPDLSLSHSGQMKSANSHVNLFPRQIVFNICHDMLQSAVAAAIQHDKSLRRFKHKALFMAEIIGYYLSIFFSGQMGLPAYFRQPV